LNKCGMRLEWARTLLSYGVTLLKHHGIDDASYQQGWKYLQDAGQAFHECGASLDLQRVKRILARYTAPALRSIRKSTRQTR
jgi:hypothetical protein